MVLSSVTGNITSVHSRLVHLEEGAGVGGRCVKVDSKSSREGPGEDPFLLESTAGAADGENWTDDIRVVLGTDLMGCDCSSPGTSGCGSGKGCGRHRSVLGAGICEPWVADSRRLPTKDRNSLWQRDLSADPNEGVVTFGTRDTPRAILELLDVRVANPRGREKVRLDVRFIRRAPPRLLRRQLRPPDANLPDIDPIT